MSKTLFQDSKRPIVISGPCSAESETQVIDTAKAIAAIDQISVFRAGLWKPRTRPGSFEGVGNAGLNWLQKAKEATGLAVATEVANAQHVDLCLKHDIDVLWIGARTTVSPFTVQEIADSLRGTDLPVLVKNPIHQDIDLWIGAIERLEKAGISQIIPVHRGFSSYEKMPYRFAPHWEIPIQLRTLFPHLDIIVDPSHISGSRALLFEIAQKAIDLDMAGLMIESHITPNEALSDANQQVTPNELAKLLRDLTFRKSEVIDPIYESQLEDLRKHIDEVDQELFLALSKRIDLVRKIGEHKRLHNITILQLERWREIIESRMIHGKTLNLREDFIQKLLEVIHDESIQTQTSVINALTTEIDDYVKKE